jgi:type I restriction enzyme, R subunit
MTEHPRSERLTHQRVLSLLTSSADTGGLGYRSLGDWSKRENNRCIETALLRENLKSRGYSEAQIAAVLQKLEVAADVRSVSAYEANQRTYHLMRYGVPVQVSMAQAHETVHLIDWEHPERNDFAVAEEVTLKGGYERRPDLVIFLNGLVVAVIELKRSSVDLADGVRQLITNQEEIFNRQFFSTVQLAVAGNDSQGLRYGTAGTPEQFFVEWKDEQAGSGAGDSLVAGALLDRPLAQMFGRARLLDFIQNFMVFDAGQKKVPRQHQFLGMKAAQERIIRREGGVVWHTQGSGKSIFMVLLAKWLLEFDPDARILVVTDREELDKQISGVMRDTGVIAHDSPSPRITSRSDFVTKLGAAVPRLLCALLHKFDVADLKGPAPPVHGRFYVFVDECHRTQGGDMNRQMKRWLPVAIFVGFTGTPLLRRDKQMTRDVFGTYIHTYKFHQAVADGVVLDLKYEARNVPQRITSPEAIDQWFESRTARLNNFQKAILRKHWGTLEDLMSAAERKQRIIASIIEDFAMRPRLNDNRGTAILVASSIHDACHYFRLFQNTPFGQYCGIITSYEPNPAAISKEPPGGDERYKFDTYRQHVLKADQTTSQYEDDVKRRFIREPANLKLLIVVSKLLTGFDAPSCSYIYLDNELRDHNLFQAICRTNRLDGDDKDYGYIVDFKELFGKVQQAIAVYSSDELDPDEGDGGENNVRLRNWLEEGRRKLDEAREALHYLCDPVLPPRGIEQFLRHFCGDAASPDALNETEPLRVAYYKQVAVFIRAYAAIASNLAEAGYSDAEAERLRSEAESHADIRAAIKKHAGEEIDVKPYEADMRHLLNTYVQADPACDLGGVAGIPLTDLIIRTGIHDAIAAKLNQKGQLSQKAVADGIINNIRKTIIRDQLTDPLFYEQMSKLLEDLIRQSREDAAAYAEFLKKAEALIQQLGGRKSASDIPPTLRAAPEAAVIYRNLPRIMASITDDAPEEQEERNVVGSSEVAYGDPLVTLALEIDRTMKEKAPAGFRGDKAREAQVLNALFPLMKGNREATIALFELISHQQGYK